METSQLSIVDQPNASVSGPSHSLPIDMMQRSVLWLFIAISWLVFIEPSPYELMFPFALLVFLMRGMTVSRVMIPYIVFLILYNVGGAFSVVQVSHSSDAVMFIVTSFYMATTALFFAFLTAKSPTSSMMVIRSAFVFAALIASVLGLMGYFNIAGTGELFAPQQRAQATFKDANVYSTYLILPAMFLIHGLATGTGRHNVLSACTLMLIIAAIFLAFSRGAWLVLILSTMMTLGLTFIVTPSLALRSRIILYTIAGCIAVVCLLVFALSIEEVRTLFLERAQLVQDYDGGETGRFGNQLNSIPLLLQSPNGIGPIQFREYFGEDPHNVYLNAFFSYGWLGGFSYLLLTIATIGAGWRSVFTATPWQHFSIIVFSVLFCSMLQGLQIDTDHWRHFYLLLGLSWGLYAATEQYRINPHSVVG